MGTMKNVGQLRILHKMHGCVTDPESMVITESDYIQYLTNLNDADRGMPEVFRKNIIPQYTLLFQVPA